jgi:hypothetical protein
MHISFWVNKKTRIIYTCIYFKDLFWGSGYAQKFLNILTYSLNEFLLLLLKHYRNLYKTLFLLFFFQIKKNSKNENPKKSMATTILLFFF